MDYVIWGTGRRGRNIYKYLNGKVEVFIESDKDKVGNFLFGIKTVNFQEYLDNYKDKILIVSPFYDEEIIDKLQREHIRDFFRTIDCPKEFSDFYIEESFKKIRGKLKENDEIYIIGVNLLGIVLATYLKEKGYNTILLDVDNTDLMLKRKIELCEKIRIEEFDSKKHDLLKNVVVTSGKNNPVLVDKTFNGEWIDAFWLRDLLPECFQNKTIQKFKNKHKESRCFIIATGPSLKIQDLDKLYEKHEICISMNKIFYSFDQTKWRPNYYVGEDRKLLECYAENIKKIKCPKFISDAYEYSVDEDEECYRYRYQIELPESRPGGFVDYSWGYASGYSVIFGCIYLALYLGIKKIYLLGVDNNYIKNVTDPANHFYGNKDIVGRMNPSSILPCYPDTVYENYLYAKRLAEEKYDAIIYNATRGGKLECFKRVDFDELMGD